MNHILKNAGLAVMILALSVQPAFAQEIREPTPTLDALRAAVAADPRVRDLKVTNPADLVSEAEYTLEWPKVHERDLLWKCRIWRTVDFQDARNRSLLPAINNRIDLYAVFAAGVAKGRYKAYSNIDDRFTRPITIDSVYAIMRQEGVPDHELRIWKFMIKQDWLYIGPEKKLVSRIIGIAPVVETVAPDGVTTDSTLFWLYYPSMRPYLREQKIAVIDGSAANLDQLFEQWRFASPIRSVRQSEPGFQFLPLRTQEYMLRNY